MKQIVKSLLLGITIFSTSAYAAVPIITSTPITTAQPDSNYTYTPTADSGTWAVTTGTTLPSWLTFTPSAFTQLGTAPTNSDRVIEASTSLVMDNNNTPYVVYQETLSKSVSVVKFDGTSAFVNVGNSDFTGGRADYPSIALDSNNIPYVAYVDALNAGQVTVMVLNTTTNTWETLGNVGFSTGSVVVFPFIELDSNDVPYVVYETNNQAQVMKYDNGTNTWIQVGSDVDVSLTGASKPSIAIDSQDALYVAYQDNTPKATVKKYNGVTDTWDLVTSGFGTNFISEVSVEIDANDTPYVLYKDDILGLVVKKYNATTGIWDDVGGALTTGGSYASLEIGSDNIPYVSYNELGIGATVMKFDGTNWVIVVASGFNGIPAVQYTSIGLDNNNIPHVAYTESYVATNPVYVWKLNPDNILKGTAPADILTTYYDVSLTVSGAAEGETTAHNFQIGGPLPITTIITTTTTVAVTSTINVITTDGGDEIETRIKFDPSLRVLSNGENERETRTNNRNIRGAISTAGVLTTSIAIGNGVISSLENQRGGSQTIIDANGNINSVLTIDADNHLDTTLENDGTVTHKTTAKGVITEVRSSVKGATITVDAQGTTKISSEVQDNGFIYRAIITVALDGTAKSRIVKIDIATNNEIESMPTLVIEGSFESGNKIEAFELNNMVYVKVSTSLNNAITIK